MTTCERCGHEVKRRRRCDICKRMCCSGCLEFPHIRGGIIWCDPWYKTPGKIPKYSKVPYDDCKDKT